MNAYEMRDTKDNTMLHDIILNYTFPVQYCEHTHYSFQNVESSLLFAVETQRRLTNRAFFALECSISL